MTKALSTLFTSLAIASPLAAEQIIYVNVAATGTNNGTSWDDAYVVLQDALEDAAETDDTATPGACPADLTDNCTVGVPDLLALLATWG